MQNIGFTNIVFNVTYHDCPSIVYNRYYVLRVRCVSESVTGSVRTMAKLKINHCVWLISKFWTLSNCTWLMNK